MAPARLNTELRKSLTHSVIQAAARRRVGGESIANQRLRIARLLAVYSDTHDWTAEGRAEAANLFL